MPCCRQTTIMTKLTRTNFETTKKSRKYRDKPMFQISLCKTCLRNQDKNDKSKSFDISKLFFLNDHKNKYKINLAFNSRLFLL